MNGQASIGWTIRRAGDIRLLHEAPGLFDAVAGPECSGALVGGIVCDGIGAGCASALGVSADGGHAGAAEDRQ